MNAISWSRCSPLKVLCALLLCVAISSSSAFTTPPSAAVRHGNSVQSSIITASSSLSSASDAVISDLDWGKVTDEWELDCYSRPVLVDGKKKLWEILLTDSSGNMRIQRVLPSNKVNSREVRRVVEEIIDNSEVKPSTIRFFRGAMFNMVCTRSRAKLSHFSSMLSSHFSFATFRSILLYLRSMLLQDRVDVRLL